MDGQFVSLAFSKLLRFKIRCKFANRTIEYIILKRANRYSFAYGDLVKETNEFVETVQQCENLKALEFADNSYGNTFEILDFLNVQDMVNQITKKCKQLTRIICWAQNDLLVFNDYYFDDSNQEISTLRRKILANSKNLFHNL